MNISVILVTITVSEPDRDLAGGSSWGLWELITWFNVHAGPRSSIVICGSTAHLA